MSSDRIAGQVRWWLQQARANGNPSSLHLKALERIATGRLSVDDERLLSFAQTVGDSEHPPGVSPNPDKEQFQKGDFVFSPANRLGIGRLLETGSTEKSRTAIVEYFDSPTRQEVREVQSDKIVGARISDQTPCYVRMGDDEWRTGRVRRHLPENEAYEIDFPGKKSKVVSKEKIRVRWARPTGDPTDVLGRKHHSSLYFRSQRLQYVETILRQRALAQGYTGLLSANIDLYRHQVEVVRRVLQDPIQRYLLADEVGLGKTIEAGAILRQYLLDLGVDADALVAVPKSLRGQWEEELESKFGIGYLPGQVDVVSLENLLSVSEGRRPGMLIIDEAHRVARWHGSSEKQQQYQAIRRLSHLSERLLLLSATPAHREDLTFLAMLHLIDPAMYSLDDTEGFEERLRKREEVREFLLDLTEEEDPFWLREAARDLMDVFPSDRRLSDLCGTLIDHLDSDSPDAEERDSIVQLIRLHLRETYRLHHRMLRNRRHRVRDAVDTRRSRNDGQGRALFEEYGMDDRKKDLHDVLDDWRLDAASAAKNHSIRNRDASSRSDVRDRRTTENASTNETEKLIGLYARLYELFVEAAASDVDLLRFLALRRLDEAVDDVANAYRQIELSSEEKRALRTPVFEGEEDLLKDLVRIASRDLAPGSMRQRELLLTLLDHHTNEKKKAVVFTSRAETADVLFDFLSRRASSVETVAGHLASMDPETRNDELYRFQNESDCKVLIADQSGEEGRNLQNASLLVHYDLPWDPNRIEQRTGRLDRIGHHGRPLQTHVFLGPDIEHGLPTVYEAWHRILRDGFGVYEDSIASLQFLVDRLMPQVRRRLFKQGTEDLSELIDTIREQVENENQHIRDQDVLDAIDAHKEEAEAFFNDLSHLDNRRESHDLQQKTDGWIASALNFHRSSKPYPQGVLKYDPDFHGRTQVPRDQILNRFAPAHPNPVSYHRPVASRLEGVELLRVGHPFFEAMDAYLEWDDRGRTYALWRHARSWPEELAREWVGYRLDFVVEADPEPLKKATRANTGLDSSALMRRADRHFPPRVETVFIDVDGSPPPDRLQSLLHKEPKKKEEGGQDTNLTQEHEGVLHHFVGKMQWENKCQEARSEAEAMLRTSADFQDRTALGREDARRTLRERLERLRARTNSSLSTDRSSSLNERVALERQIGKALIESIETPSVRLESIGFLVASTRSLREFLQAQSEKRDQPDPDGR